MSGSRVIGNHYGPYQREGWGMTYEQGLPRMFQSSFSLRRLSDALTDIHSCYNLKSDCGR